MSEEVGEVERDNYNLDKMTNRRTDGPRTGHGTDRDRQTGQHRTDPTRTGRPTDAKTEPRTNNAGRDGRTERTGRRTQRRQASRRVGR